MGQKKGTGGIGWRKKKGVVDREASVLWLGMGGSDLYTSRRQGRDRGSKC